MGHVIDCDARPFVPDGLRVVEHQKGGLLTWDPGQLEFHLSEGQKHGNIVEGNNLRGELKNKPVLNACVLDFLLANLVFVSTKFLSKDVCFWGTIYTDPDGYLCVRCLHSDRDGCIGSYVWLDEGLDDRHLAVLRAF